MTRSPNRAWMRRCALSAVSVTAWVGAFGASSEWHWADVESQIQYGYYAEDLRALENLASGLFTALEQGGAAADPQASYFAALAEYRLAELVRDRDRRAAANAAGRCLHALDVRSGAGDDAEALALKAACLGVAHALESLHLPLAGGQPEAAMARALKLAPHNPRVVLLDAVLAYERHGTRAERDTTQRLEEATALFELERRGLSVTPGWGAAEAYDYLGALYLERGDGVAARGALERALLIAPDFARPRRLLKQIVG